MQLSLNGYDLLLLYALKYLPYATFLVFLILLVRDIQKRKLHKSTVILLVTTVTLFVLLWLFSGAI